MKGITPKQKKAANIAAKTILDKNPKTKGEILREAGYSPSIAKAPSIIWDTKGFQKALSKLSDDKYLKKLDGIATDDSDKRGCLEAIKMIFQLKGRFETKVRLTAYEERDKILKDVLE